MLGSMISSIDFFHVRSLSDLPYYKGAIQGLMQILVSSHVLSLLNYKFSSFSKREGREKPISINSHAYQPHPIFPQICGDKHHIYVCIHLGLALAGKIIRGMYETLLKATHYESMI
ncbi:hypothetical protein ACJX0J_011427, partial [Zea mays]